MANVFFIDPEGNRYELDVPEGCTLMQAAVDHAVPGILGDCGGASTCATCQGYIAADYLDKLPTRTESEEYMLEAVPDYRDNSRLCCQIKMRADLAGISIQLPDEQI